MNEHDRHQALSFVTSIGDEPHDGLADLSAKLGGDGPLADFWWREHPVSIISDPPASHWPVIAVQGQQATIPCNDGSGLMVPLSAIDDFLRENLPSKSLSAAEFALLLDLCSGLTLDESASASGVAVATRRKQLKSVFRKFGTGGQAETISLMGRMLARFAADLERVMATGANAWDSYARFLPKAARFGTILQGGVPVRYLDLGPVDGRPVIMLHSMLFPHLDASDVALFDELGWRTLWPVRPGCLTTTRHASQGWDAHCKQAVEGIRAVHDLAGGAPAPVVALVSSAAYAVAYAESAPERVARIDFLATCFSAGRHRLSNLYPLDGVLRLLRQNGPVAVAAIQHLASSLSKRDQFEASARRVFGDCAMDLAVLDQDFATPERAERFRYAVQHSVDTMRMDYMSQIHFSWRRAAALSTLLQFWHGSDDGVHNLADLKALSATVTPEPPRVFSGVGHHAQGEPLHRMLREVAKTYPN